MLGDDKSYTVHKPSKTREYNSDAEWNTQPVSFIKYKVNNKPKTEFRSMGPIDTTTSTIDEGIGIKVTINNVEIQYLEFAEKLVKKSLLET